MVTPEDLTKKLRHLPSSPGAYMMKDEKGEVIYVGKAVSLRSRVRSYFQKGQMHAPKVQAMVMKIADVEWIVTDSAVEALMLECNLIKKHRPYYNVRLRDDKHYPYLCLTTSEPFPRVIVTRRSKLDGNRYFGPYTDSLAMRESQRLIRRVFKIRGCNKKLTTPGRRGFQSPNAGAATTIRGSESPPTRGGLDRACLNFHMNQCLSPCSGAVSAEEYAGLVRDTCLFLEGRHDSLIKRMTGEMGHASEEMEFERAARLRDQIEALRKLVEHQKIISTAHADQDVISLFIRNGTGCVQMLFIRTGRLIGQETFFMDGVTDVSPEEALGQFIKQYYGGAAGIPSEILVSHDVPEQDVVEQWLRTKRGGAVHLRHPQRGEKRKLTDLAMTNADLASQREIEDIEDDECRRLDMLESLAEVLGLPVPPERIEAYDISNIQGQEAVGSMVVFENGMPAKSEYRRFKIRTLDQPDDCGMTREVLRRRFAQAAQGNPKFARMPDLLLVDGGKGQLNVALEVLAEAGKDIPAIGLAKQFEEIHRPGGESPVLLSRDSSALHLLQRIRDEAHRFAQAYHHKLREKKTRESVLDSIPGVGPRRRKALIKRFGTVAGVKRASLEDLLQVPGMTESVAKTIYERFNVDKE